MRLILAVALLMPFPAMCEVVTFDEAAAPILGLRALPDPDPAGALVDWYPHGGAGFRLSGGFREKTLSSRNSSGLIPYLGIGWQGATMGGKLLVGLDMGTFYNGHRPDLRMTNTGRPGGSAAGEDVAENRLDPVFSLTFTYRF